MRARVIIASLIALSAAHARAQGNLTGFTSRDCVGFVDVGALGGELYAVKYIVTW